MSRLETMPATFSQEEITQPAKHDSMEQLFVVHRSGSIVLFSHHFDEKSATDQQGDDIHGAAIDAMDKLLGEILSNDGHIRQIVYADKILSFTYGQHCSFILVSELLTNEAVPRLERFATAFEHQFTTKLENDFNIDMNEYVNARQLVHACFF